MSEEHLTDEGWERLNAERVRLIDRNVNGPPLSWEESARLAHLQALADDRIRKLAPIPSLKAGAAD